MLAANLLHLLEASTICNLNDIEFIVTMQVELFFNIYLHINIIIFVLLSTDPFSAIDSNK